MGEFVRRLRIDWACGQLCRCDGPSLSHIALIAGFADQAHFSRTFRRVTGTMPGAFRSRGPR